VGFEGAGGLVGSGGLLPAGTGWDCGSPGIGVDAHGNAGDGPLAAARRALGEPDRVRRRRVVRLGEEEGDGITTTRLLRRCAHTTHFSLKRIFF